MSDPKDSDAQADPQAPPPEERRPVSPLIWLLLLLALAALGWWFYNRSVQSTADTPVPVPTVEPAITSEQEAAAAAERERAEANERQRVERAERAERKRKATRARARTNRAVAPIARVQPEYPPAAARAREEGTVIVRVSVDASGTPTDVSLARRSGSRDLDRAALSAVRKWRFRPAIKDGRKVASVAEVPIDFRLQDQ